MKAQRSLLIITFLLACPFASAGEITAVSKKTSMVKIDEAAKKGTKVCFKKGKQEIACGKVVKSSGSTSFVKVEKSLIGKLKKGMTTEVAGGKNAESAAGAAEADESVPADKAAGGAPYSFGIYGIYNPSLMGPSSFKKDVTYKVPPADGSATTLFESTDYGMSLISLGLQGDMFISYPFGIGAGFRMRFFTFPKEIAADYNPSNGSNYATTSQNASAMGVFVSGFYYYGLGSGMGLKLGGGLDIDMSTVSFTAGEWTETSAGATEDGELYNLTSKLMVVSLKLDTFFNMMVSGPFALDAGMTFFVPVMSSRSGKPTTTDANIAANAGVDAENDLLNAIDHKATFGLEFLLAAGFTF